MARCTAPVHGHRTASGERPALHAVAAMAATAATAARVVLVPVLLLVGSSGGGGGSGSSARPRWSRAGSSVVYTPAEVRALTPVRDSVEKRAPAA